MKRIIAKKFAEGKISFDELIKIVGIEEAKKIQFLVGITTTSLTKGI